MEESKEYEKLRKQFSLPPLRELREKFEVQLKIEDDGLVLQAIRNELSDKLFEIIKTIEMILFPKEGCDPDLLYQEKMVKENFREAFEVYRLFNECHYRAIALRFEHNRAKDAEFIKDLLNAWSSAEAKLKSFFKSIEAGWKDMSSETDIDPESYHG